MANSRTSNALKNSGASAIYKLLYTVLHFALRTAFIKLLGNEYTGISTLFTDILSVLSLVELGLDSSMAFALYRPLAKHDTEKVSALMNFFRKAFTIIGITVLLAGMACVPFLKFIVKNVPNIHEDIRGIFIMYVITSASSYFYAYKTILMRADQRSRIISYIQCAVNISETALEIILLFVFRQYYAYLIVHLVATVSRNLVISHIAEKDYPEYLTNRTAILDREDTIVLYKNIAALCVYNLAAVVLNSSDSIFISAFVGTVEVAIIGNFTMLTRSVKSSIQVVTNAIRPSIGNLIATTTVEREKQLFKQINFATFWIACFCSTCLVTLLNPLVGDVWLNESYKISMGIIVVVVADFYISVMSTAIGSFRSANGLYTQGWYRPALMSLINIVLDYYMGKTMGIIGIYIATLISLVSTQLWYDPYIVFKYAFHNMKPWGYYKDYVIQVCVTIFCCAATWYLANLIEVGNKYICFVLKMAVAVTVPNLILIALFFRTEEFKSVKILAFRLLRKIIRR